MRLTPRDRRRGREEGGRGSVVFFHLDNLESILDKNKIWLDCQTYAMSARRCARFNGSVQYVEVFFRRQTNFSAECRIFATINVDSFEPVLNVSEMHTKMNAQFSSDPL
jgi:hypothetical protein